MEQIKHIIRKTKKKRTNQWKAANLNFQHSAVATQDKHKLVNILLRSRVCLKGNENRKEGKTVKRKDGGVWPRRQVYKAGRLCLVATVRNWVCVVVELEMWQRYGKLSIRKHVLYPRTLGGGRVRLRPHWNVRTIPGEETERKRKLERESLFILGSVKKWRNRWRKGETVRRP